MATNIQEKRLHIFQNFASLSNGDKQLILRVLREKAKENEERNEKGEFVFDLSSIPDTVVDVIYDNFIEKIKRKRYDLSNSEQEDQGEDEPARKKRKFNITIQVLDCSKKFEEGEPYECSECKKRFMDKSNLKKHVRIHTKEKPFECKICHKRFRYSQTLKEHMNIHSGSKPYICNVCDKGFSNKSNLSRHKRTHTKIKPYKCDECGKEFTQSSNLKTHLKKIHNIIVTKVRQRKD